MKDRATMRDVAGLAGVSLKTVSRVVNGERGVTGPLVARVARAVEQLDYRHNLAASNLRRGTRTATVGVLVQDLRNDFSAGVLGAVEDLARDQGVAVISASLDEQPERERDLVARLVQRRVDGLILMPATTDQSYLQADVLAGLSVVVVDRPARSLAVDSVVVDNVGGARAAVLHLLGHGHTRIGFLSDLLRISTAGDRHQGYREALSSAGLPLDRELVHHVRTVAEAEQRVAVMLAGERPPTAVFAARNVLTIGVVRALRDAGALRRIALVGFDDFPAADLLEPGVTVVRQDAAAVGRRAVEMLRERLDGSDAAPRDVVLPTELVTRGSGEIVATGA